MADFQLDIFGKHMQVDTTIHGPGASFVLPHENDGRALAAVPGSCVHDSPSRLPFGSKR